MVASELTKQRYELIQDILVYFKAYSPRTEFLALIFNKNEIEKTDIKHIDQALKDIKSKNAVVLIDGNGGDTNSGQLLSLILRTKFTNGYSTIIPNKAYSALVFSVFFSNAMLMCDSSYLGPIDPLFKYQGRVYKAAISTHSSDPEVSRRSKKYLESTLRFVWYIFSYPLSLIMDINNFDVDRMEMFINKFIKEPHDKPIFKKDMEAMGLNCLSYADDDPLWLKIKNYYNLATQEMENKQSHVLIETSKLTIIE